MRQDRTFHRILPLISKKQQLFLHFVPIKAETMERLNKNAWQLNRTCLVEKNILLVLVHHERFGIKWETNSEI